MTVALRLAADAVRRSPALHDQAVVGGERWRIIEAFCSEWALSDTETRILHRLAASTARDVT